MPARSIRSIPADKETASAAFVLCVESGALETQSLWAIESLRRWGGRFAKCPVIAVTPRRGLPLKASTLRAFDHLEVEWLSFDGAREWSFYGPFNKPLALTAAEAQTDRDTIIWLDSDVLVVGEPKELELSPDVDFRARPSSCIHDIGSPGDDHEHDAFWRASLEGHGISPERFERIAARPEEAESMRMYWQAGAFSYRRELRLGKTFLQSTRDQMLLNVASKFSGTYFHEQIGLAIAVHRQQLKFEILDEFHNFALQASRFDEVSIDALKQAQILHYYGSAWPETFDALIALIEASKPNVAEWLKERGPLSDQRPIPTRAISNLLRKRRSARAKRYAASCLSY